MKIAFLGKGGSGKSTLATAVVRFLHSSGQRVLAIDADHNMDFSYNLGASPSVFLGTDPRLIKRHIGLGDAIPFLDARAEAQRLGIEFRISPMDAFTSQVATKIETGLFLITAGPHTDIVRSGEHCSHSLAAPLKVYLPLLRLREGEAVVIDERAGTDPVATGILYGVDRAVIVAEPTVQSVRVAGQIADELRRAGIPFVILANKVRGEHAEFAALPQRPIAYIPFGIGDPPLESLRAVTEFA
jgi:CO dehydrogenase maturation factor